MIRLKKTNYSKLQLKPEDRVSETYVTMVQNNRYQEVKISASECRKSVRALSSLRTKN